MPDMLVKLYDLPEDAQMLLFKKNEKTFQKE